MPLMQRVIRGKVDDDYIRCSSTGYRRAHGECAGLVDNEPYFECELCS